MEIWAASPSKQMGLIKSYHTLKDFYRQAVLYICNAAL